MGEIDQLLLTAVQQSVHELYEKVIALEGIMYPAHIDRNAYSILSQLGAIPYDIPFKIVEVSKEADEKIYKRIDKDYKEYKVLQGSDAHDLKAMCYKEQFIELPMLSSVSLFEYLNKK